MTVELDHTIVYARDKRASAAFLAHILGIQVSPDLARFVPVEVDNGVSLDYLDHPEPTAQHYAFRVSRDTYDAAFTRVTERGVGYFAEPGGDGQGQRYHKRCHDGFYLRDPNGHLIELMTPDSQPV
jgi:catechol 2,3-dioxygenase-like lactoylglutathione lyase family enzyme